MTLRLLLSALLLLLLLNVRAAPVNDHFADRITLTGALPLSTTGTAAGSTFEPGEFGAPVVTSVWYRWTAPATRTVRLHVEAATTGLINVFPDTGSLPAVLDPAIHARHGFTPGRIFATFYARAGVTYAIQIFGDTPFSLGLQEVDFVINEIDVITVNGPPALYGSRQYIEIIGPPNTPLTMRRLAFYEGSDVYSVIALDGYSTDARGLLLLGSNQITGRAVSDWTGSGSTSMLRRGQHTVALFKVTGIHAIVGPHTTLTPTVFVEDAFGLGASNSAANECQDALGAKRFTANADERDNLSLGLRRDGVITSDATIQSLTPGLYSHVGPAMTLTPATVAESGGPVSLTLSRLGGIHVPLTVTLDNPAADKLTAPAAAVIPAGLESLTLTLPGINDSIPDGGRTFTLRGTYPGMHSPPVSATLTITDDDTLPAPAGLLARELFAYSPGELLSQGFLLSGLEGGFGFNGQWLTSSVNVPPPGSEFSQGTIAGPSLDPAAPSADRRLLIQPPSPGRAINLMRALPTAPGTDGTTTYFSILINPATNPAQHLGMWLATDNGAHLFIGKPGAGQQLQYVIENLGANGTGQATSAQAPVINARTVRLVVRATFGPGATDQFSLFYDPLPGAPEPAPLATKTLDAGLVNHVGVTGNGGGSLDDLRVGTTWESVTRPVYAPPVVVNEVAVPGVGAVAPRRPRNGGLTWDAFVEFFNPRSEPFDLSGATLHRDALATGAPDYTFPAGTVLAPGAALVVVAGGNVPEGHTAAFGGALVLRAPEGTDFGTTGDLWLRAANGDLINAVRHGSTSATVSRTRYPDGAGEALDFVDHPSTPGGGNASPGLEGDGTPFVVIEDSLAVHLSHGSVVEGAGWDAAQLTVTRPGSLTEPLTVQIRSSHPALVNTSPDYAVIPAGENAVTVPLGFYADFMENPDQTVTLTAIGSGYLNGTATVTVLENDRRIYLNEINAQSGGGGGGDFDEFIELYDGGLGNKSLHDFIVVLFDADAPNDAAYRVIDLQGRMTSSTGFFVIESSAFPELTSGWLTNGGGAVAIYKKRTGDGMGGGAAMPPYYDFPPGTAPVVNAFLVDAITHVTDDAPDLALVALFTPAGVQADEGPAPAPPATVNVSTGRCPDARAPFDSGAFRRSAPTPGSSNLTYPGFMTWGIPRGTTSLISDNDEDGLDNLLEYALGGVPLSLAGEDTNSVHLLPEPLDNPFGELRMFVRKGPEAGHDPRLRWDVEVSTDMIHWTTRDVVIVQEDCATLTAAYTGGGPRVQMRLKVTQEP